nr:MAG TPA: putative esterase [Ackermannviridae sp.]
MQKKVLYIYGYGSSPESSTYKWLKNNLPNTIVYSFEYVQTDPENSIPYLCSLVEELDIDIVIGSSLGGWYTMHVASICSLPSILINPVTDSTLEQVVDYVSDHDSHIVENLVKYSKEHPLFETKEHWTGYRWDNAENGYYSVLIWGDNDEVIINSNDISTELKENFLTKCIVRNGKHQLTNEEKEKYIIPYYNKLVNEIIPKVNNFYKNTMIMP